MFTMGIDIGSTTSKAAILMDGTKRISEALVRTGIGTDGGVLAMEAALQKANLSREDIVCIVATGYGRNRFTQADTQLSELSCHAKGIHSLYPGVRTIIDIGGQDAKVMNLSESGAMTNFLMNDKCAAGTGRFLDVMSAVLNVSVDNLQDMAAKADKVCRISSTCTVFAESEVISQLANGEKTENVVAGICASVASRTAALAKRIQVCGDVFMSGGVALNGGVRMALEKELNVKILYSELSQLMGALGAAVAAYERVSM